MGFWDILSALGSIVLIVLALLCTYCVTRWYARRFRAAGAGRYIRVVDRAALDHGASLVLVEVEGRYYLLGLSEKNLQLLSELPGLTPAEPPAAEPAVPFERLFRELTGRAKEPFRKKDDSR